ncbi:4Fe-4S dicluster domain-containing protein [Chloroflexota bacterium]
MEMNRRDFLKLSGAGVATALTLGPFSDKTALATFEKFSAKESKAVLYDATRCIGCRACEAACKKSNGLPAETKYNHPEQLSATTWSMIQATEVENKGNLQEVFTKRQCMHCQYPACVEACIVGALQKTTNGPVIYDDHKCIGCRYCMVACPFGVPSFEWDKPVPFIRKCDFCSDQLDAGLEPVCVTTCTTGALTFGGWDELITEARKRIAEYPDKYVNHIYGEKEAGGTSWLYLSPVSFEELGFPALDSKPVIINAERAMGAVPPVLVVVTATMAGIYWLIQRRLKMSQTKNSHIEGKE